MTFTNKDSSEEVVKFFRNGSPFNEVDYLATSEFGDKNRITEELSVAGNGDQRTSADVFGVDISDMVNSLLVEELRSSVSKTIMKKCTQTKDILFIDASGKNDLEMGQFFVETIRFENLSNVIVNGNVGASIMDSPLFVNNTVQPILSSSTIYHIGSILGCNFYVDPIMRFTHDEFIAFDTIDVQIFDVKIVEVVNEATFTPRTLAKIDYTYNIHFPKKIMVLMDTSKDLGKFKAYQRDVKISDILNKN